MDRLWISPRLVCMAMSDMLKHGRLPRYSARKVVLWGDSQIEYAATSIQRLNHPAHIFDLGLDCPSLISLLSTTCNC